MKGAPTSRTSTMRRALRTASDIPQILVIEIPLEIRTILLFIKYIRVVICESRVSEIDSAKMGKYIRYSENKLST